MVRVTLQRIDDLIRIAYTKSGLHLARKAELDGINCEVHILEGNDHDIQKKDYVKRLGADKVITFGNGNNDRKMLKVSRIGIAVCMKEGCAIDAITSADILVTSAIDALDLLLHPKRCKATLRF